MFIHSRTTYLAPAERWAQSSLQNVSESISVSDKPMNLYIRGGASLSSPNTKHIIYPPFCYSKPILPRGNSKTSREESVCVNAECCNVLWGISHPTSALERGGHTGRKSATIPTALLIIQVRCSLQCSRTALDGSQQTNNHQEFLVHCLAPQHTRAEIGLKSYMQRCLAIRWRIWD